MTLGNARNPCSPKKAVKPKSPISAQHITIGLSFACGKYERNREWFMILPTFLLWEWELNNSPIYCLLAWPRGHPELGEIGGNLSSKRSPQLLSAPLVLIRNLLSQMGTLFNSHSLLTFCLRLTLLYLYSLVVIGERSCYTRGTWIW